MKKLYLFDFDGTITTFDSFIIFTFFSKNLFKSISYWVTVILFLPFKKKDKLKELFFKNFKNMSLIEFNKICNEFEKKTLSLIIRAKFKNFINDVEKDHQVVVVSASISNYLKPWCNKMNFDLLCTELEIKDGNLTGNFLNLNCNGNEKVNRIKEKYNLSEFDEVHVFGNSKDDLPMMSLGTHKYYRFF